MSRLKFQHTAMAILGLGLLAYFVYAFAPRPIAVDLVKLERGDMQLHVEEDGYTRTRDVYVLSAPVTGTVLRIKSEVGDPVVAGQTLLATILPRRADMLDPRSQQQAEANIHSAEAALTLADAELRNAIVGREQAQSDYARGQQLALNDSISSAELDHLKFAAKAAGAAVDAASAGKRVRVAELENARAVLAAQNPNTPPQQATQAIQLLAPVSGKVLKRSQESENLVSAGTPLLEIGDPQDLEIVVDLLSQDAVKVQPGAPVSIDDWGGSTPLNGQVLRVEPAGFTKVSALGIEEQRVNVVIKVLDPPAQRQGLGHGFRVNVRILIWQAKDVLRVPAGALFRKDQSWAVFRVREGYAELAPLLIGQHNGLQAQVLSGVDENDSVILHPSDHIQDGSHVEPRS